MVKVDSINNPAVSSFLSPVDFRGENKKPREKLKVPSLFSGILERVSSQDPVIEAGDESLSSEDLIKELMDEVHTAGDNLRNRPLPEEIMLYKKAVKKFLDYVVKNSFDVEKRVTGGIRSRRKKEFTLVQVVDSKLEQLAAGIMAGQIVQLELLRRLEEIKGILIEILT
jgi:uncharacterized protein YaaR (DUF327 family)